MNNRFSTHFPFEDFWINPVTTWQRFFNPQFFINYNSGDADVENHVLRQVGSYGKQLGRILDVLKVLVSRLSPGDLTPTERDALRKFNEIAAAVDSAVSDYWRRREDGVTRAKVEQLIEGLAALAKSDPDRHRMLVARLKEALLSDEGPS
jgi:hypothetical protein